MNVKFINPLLESIVTVLSTMAMVEVTAGKPSRKEGPNTLGDVTGMIDLAGDQTQGSLAISFSESAILNITEKMLGESVDSIDDTVVDVVGEITNMVTGNAKRLFSEQGIEFDLTRPSMTVGHDIPLTHTTKGELILLPFETEAGQFYVELCFTSN